MKILTIFFVGALTIIGPIIPYFCIKYFTKIRDKESLIYSSVISTFVFFLCVSLPYHFQGYSKLESVSTTSNIIGIVCYEPIKTFDYIYVSMGFGPWWLFMSLLCVVFGDAKNRKMSALIKIMVSVVLSSCFYYLQNYQETIGVVLE